ncbi:54S ribosomal protein L36, mitochondrial [Zancudomyces culisetae]|uniref:54S ribosomal protein L36, mitochondrial n=1 Tax=Zancudomyces culisetae TaxID=1213189 RepID=A0A1R1PPG1_ZANCU|nr:54S ribosomal protein L36, mitochondrial [Zancudomyces culisetae]|eukprot:OMH82854.1 54S ribosomal protein L36, mitochondrial [Zancudomyces culisetae]
MAKVWRPRKIGSDIPKPPELQPRIESFRQKIILSDGSTFTLHSTSPKSVIKLAKDTRNHPLWNPQYKLDLQDEGGHLSRFNKKFGEYGNIGEDFDDFLDIEEKQ